MLYFHLMLKNLGTKKYLIYSQIIIFVRSKEIFHIFQSNNVIFNNINYAFAKGALQAFFIRFTIINIAESRILLF